MRVVSNDEYLPRLSEKEHVRLEYSQRIQLLALFKQVRLGSYAADKDTETGYFDMVGADRRYSL